MKDSAIYCCDPPAPLTKRQRAAFKRKVLRLAKPMRKERKHGSDTKGHLAGV